MHLQSDDFALFGLPQRFAQERSEIDARWKELQRQAHPDRHAQHGAAAQRVALQWSVRINEAYQRLKDPLKRAAYLCELEGARIGAEDPLKRAAYLCELQGARIGAEDNTAMPADFLMQQMQWREALDEAQDGAAVQALEAEVRRARAQALQRCGELIDGAQDFAAAAGQVRALMFIERFARDIDRRLEHLGQ